MHTNFIWEHLHKKSTILIELALEEGNFYINTIEKKSIIDTGESIWVLQINPY